MAELSALPRLSSLTARKTPPEVAVPAYDRATIDTGIVHIGIGAFHRAHQAVYTDDVLGAGDRRWGICGVSLRSRSTYAALAPQDGLYCVAVRGEETRLRVIGALREIVVAPDGPEAALRRLEDPAVSIVSLTVTEKGYCHDPATGGLDEDHPMIRGDLENPEAPRSAIGYLAAAIARRRRANAPPFTILCCDNLPANGRTVHRVLSRYAALVSAELGAFVQSEIACPSTMVDRIVPATTDGDREDVSRRLGLTDAWPVVTEPFTQWVIEDRFAGGRPAWEMTGAQLVADVAPYEMMKLRLLNGAHSAMAYLGSLAGLETVADTVAEQEFGDFVWALMGDAIDTLKTPAKTELLDYREALFNRFGNPQLRHRVRQIAMDGSQKLPQRLLATVRDRLARNLPVRRHALAVAAWMRCVAGTDENGDAIELDDPMADELGAIARRAGPVPLRLARGLLSVRGIFGEDLPQDPRFTGAVTNALGDLIEQGSRRSVAAYAAEQG